LNSQYLARTAREARIFGTPEIADRGRLASEDECRFRLLAMGETIHAQSERSPDVVGGDVVFVACPRISCFMPLVTLPINISDVRQISFGD
jgi:hypothetical protein